MKKKRKSKSDSRFGLILDCSVAIAWCFTDESSPYSQSILDALTFQSALVPNLWPLEIANVLLVGERRKRSTQADTVQWLRFILSLPIVVDDETSRHAFNATVNLARSHNLSAYDSAYLELALRFALPLATLDKKLKMAATAVGVTLY